jgi:hypothetical protein
MIGRICRKGRDKGEWMGLKMRQGKQETKEML